jgi:hypothetical protein
LGTAGSSAQVANVVNLIDSDDDDEAVLLASVPQAASGSLQGRGSAQLMAAADSHMHDGSTPVQDAGVPDESGAWAPEDDAMEDYFLSDDEAKGARAAQPQHLNTNASNPGPSGPENSNKAANNDSARKMNSIKELVTDFARGTGTGKYLVRSAHSISRTAAV